MIAGYGPTSGSSLHRNIDATDRSNDCYALDTDVVTLDQSAADMWQALGQHVFATGGGLSVRLDDNTGEPFSLRRQIVFDAIRLTRTDLPAVDAGTAIGASMPADGSVVGDGGAPESDAGSPPPSAGGCGCRMGATLALMGMLFVTAMNPRLYEAEMRPSVSVAASGSTCTATSTPTTARR